MEHDLCNVLAVQALGYSQHGKQGIPWIIRVIWLGSNLMVPWPQTWRVQTQLD